MNQKGFMNLVLIGAFIFFVVCAYFVWSKNFKLASIVSGLPTICRDEQEGIPVITSLSSYSGSIGNQVELNGCNFAGFEGDKNVWIENSQGIKGILYGEASSTSKLIKVVLKSPICQKDNSYSGLPCDASLNLNPGIYKIYVSPWGKESDKIDFTIK